MNDESKFFSDVSELIKGTLDLTKYALPLYKEFADDIIHERITNIEQIERQLDSMVSYCFDKEILLLYKAILRKLYCKYPDMVKDYVRLYYDMYENDSVDVD